MLLPPRFEGRIFVGVEYWNGAVDPPYALGFSGWMNVVTPVKKSEKLNPATKPSML